MDHKTPAPSFHQQTPGSPSCLLTAGDQSSVLGELSFSGFAQAPETRIAHLIQTDETRQKRLVAG